MFVGLNKPWDWLGISANNNITLKNIQDNPEQPWSWYGISYNTFGAKEENRQRIIERTQQFKEELMRATWNPETALGKANIMTELAE
jgi:hypothetical protein